MVRKKSVMSFLTSMCGAVINVTLCLLLIPRMGVQGAAVAAAVSYFAVFLIRAVNTQKYVKFNMHPPILALNSAVLLLQCAVMVLELRYWMVIEAVCFIAIVVLNAKPILRGVVMLLGGMIGAIKGKKGGKNAKDN